MRQQNPPPYYDDGPDVSGTSIACADVCAVPRLQSNSMSAASLLPRVTRLDKAPRVIGSPDGIAVPVPLPLRPTLLMPAAIWSGSRLIIAADSTVAEVHADGTAEALAVFAENEHAVAVMDTPLGLATFVQREEDWNSEPRLYLRVPSARRRAAR